MSAGFDPYQNAAYIAAQSRFMLAQSPHTGSRGLRDGVTRGGQYHTTRLFQATLALLPSVAILICSIASHY